MIHYACISCYLPLNKDAYWIHICVGVEDIVTALECKAFKAGVPAPYAVNWEPQMSAAIWGDHDVSPNS